MEQKVLVTGISIYNFENDGQKVSGIKVTYFTNEPTSKKNSVGYLPVQVNVSENLADKFKTLPGVYNASIQMVSGRNNKPELAITDFTFVEEYDFGF